MSYILRVYQQSQFVECITPNINNRKVTIEFQFPNLTLPLSMSVINGEWSILSDSNVTVMHSENIVEKLVIADSNILQLTYEGVEFAMIVENSYPGYTSYKKFKYSKNRITIGNRASNNIYYNRKLVSGYHASIEYENDQCYIVDQNSSNGTYQNGLRVFGKQILKFGDVVDILGLRIVYLTDLLAINEVNYPLIIEGISPIETTIVSQAIIKKSNEDEYYSRSPRQIEKIDDEVIEIEGPPTPSKNRRQPIMFVIGPAVTMVIPITIGVLFTTYSMQNSGGSSSPMLFMGIITSVTAAFIGAFWALTNYRYNKKIELEDEKKRNDKYRSYLVKMRSRITEKQDLNRDKLLKMYPEIKESINFIVNKQRRSFERNVNHSDFLTVRLGIGERPSFNSIQIPKERFSMIDDDLMEEPDRIKNDLSSIKRIPITINLIQNRLIGVLFDEPDDAIKISRSIITQLTAYHSYQDVKIVFLLDATQTQMVNSIKWIPHLWSSDEKIRFIGTSEQSIADISYYLTTLFREREELLEDQKEGFRPLPHYVIFVTNPSLIDNETMSKYILNPSENIGITSILLYEKIDKLPNHCNIIIQKDKEFSGYYSLDNSFDGLPNLSFDEVTPEEFHDYCVSLANVQLKENHSGGKIPNILSFLDMYKTSSIDSLDIYQRWMQNRTFESMKAMIGYKGEDQPLFLDIHEKYHGPHGLVAGTTGSGKSETLQTYICSLALNYHPHEVSFILIDYKGGGMANSFETLPHLAGIITNLGGNQTTRALTSINSEIKRRQAIFSESKVKHIDEYIELFRSDKVKKPVPHLIIIADEFAELKKEQPEFVRALVSASRVGRSLGVHLILATQKPSGVVDDEIWGNSRFRLCLRVQDKQDSNEMLKRSDAAYITNPGRGFFQVGNNEIFEEFQSGFSGALYEPDIPFLDAKSNVVNMISLWGRRLVPQSAKMGQKGQSGNKKQLPEVVSNLHLIAKKYNIKPIDQIWLPQLNKQIFLEDVITESAQNNPMDIVIGMVDDPVNQRQFAFSYNFIESGNLLIAGSTMSGKTTLLQTLLFGLIKKNDASKINVYVADYNSRILKSFEKCPQVGSVYFDDEEEKANKMVRMIQKELVNRKRKLSEVGIGSFREYCRRFNDLPAIIFAIDNYSAYTELNPKHEEDFIVLSRESSSYGIYLLFTINNPNDLRTRIRQNFPSGIGLQLADRFEYESILSEKIDLVADDKIAGRGMVKTNIPLEFQVAIAVKADFSQINQKISEEFESMFFEYEGVLAKSIPTLPEDLSLEHLLKSYPMINSFASGLPVGYDSDESTPISIDLFSSFCISISGASRTGKSTLMRNWIKYTNKLNSRNVLIDRVDSSHSQDGINTHISTAEQLFDFLQNDLRNEFIARGDIKTQFSNNKSANKSDFYNKTKPLFIFIPDFTFFLELIYNYEKDMKKFMEQTISVGKGYGIYFIATVTNNDMTSDYNSKRVFRSFIGYKEGFHLGGQTDQQRIFDFDIPVFERSKRTGVGVGHIIDEGKTKKVIVLQ